MILFSPFRRTCRASKGSNSISISQEPLDEHSHQVRLRPGADWMLNLDLGYRVLNLQVADSMQLLRTRTVSKNNNKVPRPRIRLMM